MDGTSPLITSRQGVVAAAHPLAAAAGARILGRGGNAFDAAVATAAALGVVEPFMSGLGGEGLATCWVAGDHRVRTLSFRAAVPSGWLAGKFRRREDLQYGAMAATAPAALAGWYNLLSAHGTQTLGQVLLPAIELARDGFPLVEYGAASISRAAGSLCNLAGYDLWNTTFAGRTGTARVGQVLRQPDLAATLATIAADGPRALHGGGLGAAVVAHVQALGGCLGMADLAAVSPEWGRPVVAAYRGLTVHVPRPSSQAFQLLLTLRILDDFYFAGMDQDGPEHLDAVWRAARLAAMECVAHGDPSEDDVDRLLSDDTLDRLRARARDGRPVEGPVGQWPAAGPEQHATSLSVADRAGNLVCITQSLGSLFGCGVVVPGTGICLNNALHWGGADPAAPNGLAPGRMLTTPMAPSVATRDRRPVLALGASGGSGTCQMQAQALVQHVDFGLALPAAIAAPRARLWDGRRVTAESRIAAPVLEALRGRGHDAGPAAAWTTDVGGMQAVGIDPATGIITGAADPRIDGWTTGA